jgi:hypothetical protein
VLEEEPTGGVEDPLTVSGRVAAQVRLARHGYTVARNGDESPVLIA